MYAETYDLLTIKLLVLHVSQHQDEALVKDIWNRIFNESKLNVANTADFLLNVWTAMQGVPPAETMDRIQAKIVPLGRRFHGSESSFPLSSCNVYSDSATSDELTIIEHIAQLLVVFQLANTDAVPPGWVVRVLARCGIPYVEIWDVFHQMYESQVCDICTGPSTESDSHFSLQGSPVHFTTGCSYTLSCHLLAFPDLTRGGKAHS